MARYYVIEMWENQTAPVFVLNEKDEALTFDDLDEAQLICDDLQDGIILDMKELKIIKP